MVNSKTKKECDKEDSYVIIKPKKPFGKKDYTVEAYLSCGFDKKDNNSKKSNNLIKETNKKTQSVTEKTCEKTSTKDTQKKIKLLK